MYTDDMTRLDRAIALVKALPDSEQERAAYALLAFADEQASYVLTPEQIDGIEHAIAQADAGEFAADADLVTLFGRPL